MWIEVAELLVQDSDQCMAMVDYMLGPDSRVLRIEVGGIQVRQSATTGHHRAKGNVDCRDSRALDHEHTRANLPRQDGPLGRQPQSESLRAQPFHNARGLT